jgi:uncharacterized membrane protein
MLSRIGRYIVLAWNFLFNHEVSPVRNIPDVAIRHYVLQALGLMWAIALPLALGSYTFLAASIIGHVVLIAALAVTVATLTTAAVKPTVFQRGSGRPKDGEHN